MLKTLVTIKTDLKWIAVLIAPFLLWLAFYHNFFIGNWKIGGDTFNYYHAMIYHFQSLIKGQFPLWMPFQSWGTFENFDFRTVGDFNPFFLLIPLQTFIGMSLSTAFIVTIALYFWIGCLGFYTLAHQITKDRFLSLIAYILWMFSGMGVVFWEQLAILTIIVPTIWFFVFLIGFLQAQKQDQLKFAAGITFALMIILTTYLPFFFLTVFLCFITASFLVAPKDSIQSLGSGLDFIIRNPWSTLFFITMVVLSAIPWGLWYEQIRSGQNIMLIDRAPQGSKDQLAVSLGMINSGSIFSESLWQEMFSGFSAKMNFRSYVPLFAFIVGGLSVINRLRKEQLIIFISGLFLFLVAAAGVTPVHKFLYEHIFIFRMFRNYFMFWQFIEAIVILYVVGELKEFLTSFSISHSKVKAVAYVLGIHLFFVLFLSRLEDVPFSSFVTIVLSCAWLSLYVLGFFKSSQKIFQWGMILILMISPIDVYGYYVSIFNKGINKTEILSSPVEFSYLRPARGSGFNENSAYYDRVKLRQDESGFVKSGFVGTESAYRLYTNIPEKFLEKYVRYKFMVYDRTLLTGSKEEDYQRAAYYLSNFYNEALVEDSRALQGSFQAEDIAKSVEGSSDELRVTKFELNTVEFDTNFPRKKFIVYNDSFNKGWQARIDGKNVLVFRSNIAFKGVWVEAGQHHVSFTFNPLEQIFLLSLLCLFIIFLIILLWVWGARWLRS